MFSRGAVALQFPLKTRSHSGQKHFTLEKLEMARENPRGNSPRHSGFTYRWLGSATSVRNDGRGRQL